MLALATLAGCRPERPERGPESEVVALLGTSTIERRSFLDYLRDVHGAEAFSFAPEVKSRLLDQFLEEELARRYLTPARSKGLTRAEIRIALARELGTVEVTDRDIYNEYSTRRAEFHVDEAVRAQQILVADRRQAEQLERRLAEGEDFNALSMQYSKTPNAAGGGDLGIVRRGQLPAVLEEVLFRLRPGEISPIVATDYGLHLFKMTARYRDEELPYSEVAVELRDRLQREREQVAYRKLVARLRAQMPVRVLPRSLGFPYSGEFPAESAAR